MFVFIYVSSQVGLRGHLIWRMSVFLSLSILNEAPGWRRREDYGLIRNISVGIFSGAKVTVWTSESKLSEI